MEVNLEGQKLVLYLDEFEARIAQKTMPIVAPMFSFTAKIFLRFIFLFLQTDRQRFKEIRQRLEAGEDLNQVMGPLMSELSEIVSSNPDYLNTLDDGPSLDAIEQLLPVEGEKNGNDTRKG